MGIFSGILCFICFCLLSAKAAAAKLHLEKMDKILMKIHKPVSAFLILSCFVHILCVIPILENRNFLVTVSGIIIVSFMILLICLCHMIRDRKQKLSWHRILTILMAVGITGHFTAYVTDFNDYRKSVANIRFDDVDLEKVADGVYTGEYDVGYIYAQVEVEIRDGAIVSIRLREHRNERGKEAESIIYDIISEQEIDVDAISGATNSSNVIKKAIEQAIVNPQGL